MAQENGVKINIIGMALKHESEKNVPVNVVNDVRKAYEKNQHEQVIENDDVSFVTGNKQVSELLKQGEVLTGKKVPRLFIADTMERMKLAESFAANQYNNSEDGSIKKKLRGDDYDSVHDINGAFAVGQVKDAQERFDYASSYTKMTLSPKEFFNILRLEDKNELKDKIQDVLIEYWHNPAKAAEMDAEVTKQIYKEVYGLNVDMSNEHKVKSPRMGM